MEKNKVILISQLKNDYSKSVKMDGTSVLCYTKKQLKQKFPGGYSVKAECIAKDLGKSIGTLKNGEKDLPIYEYKSSNRFVYMEKGFVEVSNGSFVALLKNMLWLWIVIIVAAAVGITLACFALTPGDNAVKEVLSIDEDAIVETQAFDEQTPIGIPGYEKFTWQEGETKVPVVFENPEGNPCYFRINLYLGDSKETGELLYQTDLITPGTGIYEIEVEKLLEKGSHNALLHYETYSIPDQKPLNGANIGIVIEVE